jgi:hypothetical protein
MAGGRPLEVGKGGLTVNRPKKRMSQEFRHECVLLVCKFQVESQEKSPNDQKVCSPFLRIAVACAPSLSGPEAKARSWRLIFFLLIFGRSTNSHCGGNLIMSSFFRENG